MTAEHTHHWQTTGFRAAFECSDCGIGGWDWHVDEVQRQEQELNDLDTKLGQALRAIGLEHADNARLRAELQAREAVVEAARFMEKWAEAKAPEAALPLLSEALKALDAAPRRAGTEEAA